MTAEAFNEELYWSVIDILNGLLTGTIIGGYYAMISIGLAMTFGVMRLVNLAHGDFIIVGAYLAVVLLNFFTNIAVLYAHHRDPNYVLSRLCFTTCIT